MISAELAEALAHEHQRLAEFSDLTENYRANLREVIAEARRAGATNQEIGDVLGVSRQRVSQLLQRKDVGR